MADGAKTERATSSPTVATNVRPVRLPRPHGRYSALWQQAVPTTPPLHAVSPIWPVLKTRKDRGANRVSQRPDSRGCSICATTVTGNIFRCGPWRATATSCPATVGLWHSVCDTKSTLLNQLITKLELSQTTCLRGGARDD